MTTGDDVVLFTIAVTLLRPFAKTPIPALIVKVCSVDDVDMAAWKPLTYTEQISTHHIVPDREAASTFSVPLMKKVDE